ncbi:hypothetical protein [Moorena sp. SIO3I6]|uniref:hypothetical protein n=1 Tax=Moorena sp. SIO3I6 TaxID=2607831 RepID=UPI0025F34B25|nr:hypothetical protein [Moorena sp. SIO3I6]
MANELFTNLANFGSLPLPTLRFFTDRVKNRVKKYFRAPWWAVANELFTNLANFGSLPLPTLRFGTSCN